MQDFVSTLIEEGKTTNEKLEKSVEDLKIELVKVIQDQTRTTEEAKSQRKCLEK